MGTFIIVIILGCAVILALKSSLEHFRGESGCCKHETTVKNKQLQEVVDQRTVYISGIHCQNCENRIKEAFNQINYLSCRDIKERKIAIIESQQYINDDEIYQIIEKAGYKVNYVEK
ncbi:MAG: heavy-metal-associated domain-containing protein [Faecalibacillus sp.]